MTVSNNIFEERHIGNADGHVFNIYGNIFPKMHFPNGNKGINSCVRCCPIIDTMQALLDNRHKHEYECT